MKTKRTWKLSMRSLMISLKFDLGLGGLYVLCKCNDSGEEAVHS